MAATGGSSLLLGVDSDDSFGDGVDVELARGEDAALLDD